MAGTNILNTRTIHYLDYWMDLLCAGLASFVARKATKRVQTQALRMDAVRRFAGQR